jgi:hypothetical protein
MFRSIRMEHTNCLQVAIKAHSCHSFIHSTTRDPGLRVPLCLVTSSLQTLSSKDFSVCSSESLCVHKSTGTRTTPTATTQQETS